MICIYITQLPKAQRDCTGSLISSAAQSAKSEGREFRAWGTDSSSCMLLRKEVVIHKDPKPLHPGSSSSLDGVRWEWGGGDLINHKG